MYLKILFPFCGYAAVFRSLLEKHDCICMRFCDSRLYPFSSILKYPSSIGSKQNQLVSTINNLSSLQIKIYASESTIRDIDLAEESMNMSRLETLTKARTFASAQANASQKNVRELSTNQNNRNYETICSK